VARSLGLDLQGEIDVGGGGKETVTGKFVKNSEFSVLGLQGFTQPLFLAVPFDELSKTCGHEFSGILGFDFLSPFVVEIDYVNKTITFHDRESYQYHGSGESIPITFDSHAHPQLKAQIAIDERGPMAELFVLDLGASGYLELNSPFVQKEHLPGKSRPAVPSMSARGIGGALAGSVGRVKELQIGTFRVSNPIALFSQDIKGANASSSAQGTIGAGIMSKFKVILDYADKRIILEPNSDFALPTEYDMSGLHFLGLGQDRTRFEIDQVAENSPGSQADIRQGDVLAAIDGKPASAYTVSELRRLFRQEKEYRLTIQRGDQRLEARLALHRRI
jgi:hypothetical protein